ncbi:MAG: cupin domain-containing protein [Acidimicrobiia bacterium]|nr:cupin domain-containing protein [Acidimicrobiia bacterium]MDH4306218.1 cupin domain-containing protein [Acidimicrobiia bacterium]MDH5292577.1 cupin domain-containing protein [Acidimicrobiia bacterium]
MTGHERLHLRLDEVPLVGGLREEDGWVQMQVQFLLDRANTGRDDFLLGWTVLPPGARHDRHLHENADEFFIVLQGQGHIYTDDGMAPSTKGDVIFTPRGRWHGFDNTGTEDVTLVWGWNGAGSLEASGYVADD